MSVLLELCSEASEDVLELFRQANFMHLISIESEFLDEAVIEMLQGLACLYPSSKIILEISVSFINFKLAVSLPISNI
jgi:hypothetical protein